MAGLVVGHPVDTIKVRQQIKGRPMIESIRYVYHNGGIHGNLKSYLQGLCATNKDKIVLLKSFLPWNGSTFTNQRCSEFCLLWFLRRVVRPNYKMEGIPVSI